MKTGFRFIKTKYKCDITNRIVLCTLECELKDHEFKYMNIVHGCKGIKGPLYKFKVIGKSRAHIDDKWDEIKGKRIAEARAKRKAYKAASKKWQTLYNYTSTLAEEANKFFCNCNKVENIEIAHIKNLIK